MGTRRVRESLGLLLRMKRATRGGVHAPMSIIAQTAIRLMNDVGTKSPNPTVVKVVTMK